VIIAQTGLGGGEPGGGRAFEQGEGGGEIAPGLRHLRREEQYVGGRIFRARGKGAGFGGLGEGRPAFRSGFGIGWHPGVGGPGDLATAQRLGRERGGGGGRLGGCLGLCRIGRFVGWRCAVASFGRRCRLVGRVGRGLCNDRVSCGLFGQRFGSNRGFGVDFAGRFRVLAPQYGCLCKNRYFGGAGALGVGSAERLGRGRAPLCVLPHPARRGGGKRRSVVAPDFIPGSARLRRGQAARRVEVVVRQRAPAAQHVGGCGKQGLAKPGHWPDQGHRHGQNGRFHGGVPLVVSPQWVAATGPDVHENTAQKAAQIVCPHPRAMPRSGPRQGQRRKRAAWAAQQEPEMRARTARR